MERRKIYPIYKSFLLWLNNTTKFHIITRPKEEGSKNTLYGLAYEVGDSRKLDGINILVEPVYNYISIFDNGYIIFGEGDGSSLLAQIIDDDVTEVVKIEKRAKGEIPHKDTDQKIELGASIMSG
jgi:hypothetical protein